MKKLLLLSLLLISSAVYADTLTCSYPYNGYQIKIRSSVYQGHMNSLLADRFYFETDNGQVIIGNLNNCFIELSDNKKS